MNIKRLWNTILIIVQLNQQLYALTHWVVTENGRIEPKLGSSFYMRRPYDLIALLDQEKRCNELDMLFLDLKNRKNQIDQKYTRVSTNGERMILDKCTDILRHNDNHDFFIASNGSDRFKLQMHKLKDLKNIEGEPRCGKFSQLPYSMSAFDHMEIIAARKQFELAPCEKLETFIPDLEPLGLEIIYSLMKNTTSWVHYNLGLLYWWRKGNGNEAIECARRALHYAPLEHKDIPLLNLGGIFHWEWMLKEALIVLRAAVDHSPNEPKNYLSLGDTYFDLGDYLNAIKSFRTFNNLQPTGEYVDLTSKVIKCILKLHTGFLEYHDNLQDILSELHEYHSQQQKWLGLQKRQLWEITPYEYDDMELVASKQQKQPDLTEGHKCVPQVIDGKLSTISCEFLGKAPGNIQLHIENKLQKMFKLYGESEEAKRREVENAQKEREEFEAHEETYNKVMVDMVNDGDNMPSILPPKYPTTMTTSNNLYFDAARWPSKEECIEWDLPLKEEENLDLPVFTPLENKGYQIHKMLNENIDIPLGTEHELPWYPPLCEYPNFDVYDRYVPQSVRQVMAKNKHIKSNLYIKKHLMKYVNDGKVEEAELGQRIITAVNKRAGPSWVLAMIASMYWRVRSNTKNALTCLAMPIEPVPKEHSDVILVSLGSLMQQMGLVENALKFASMAFKVNYLEPSTNFLLAIIHYQKNNPILAMYYLKNVLRVDPDYYDGEAERLLKLWACRIKMGSYENVPIKEEKTDGMCSERDGFNGEGVICSANGDQCKTAAIQCFRADTVKDSVKIPKILSSEQCGKHNLGSASLISTLLAAEGSGGAELDQSQLESMSEKPQDFHMRIFFGDDYAPSGSASLGDFYVSVALSDDPVPEVLLHVYDKSGTYQLSHSKCQELDVDWLHFTSMWQSIAARNINISPYLSPLKTKEFSKPHCSDIVHPSSATLDHLTAMVLRKRLPHLPEDSLSEFLGLMAGDQEASVRELGAKINIALQENTTSWILATAAALYWRVVGNTEEAVTCLRQALTYVPNDMKDIPLISLANILHRVGFLADALEVAYIALESNPSFVVNHFTAGNIHTSLGEFENAVSLYRSCLALDPNFVPARIRLKAILCTLLFDESGALRDNSDILHD